MTECFGGLSSLSFFRSCVLPLLKGHTSTQPLTVRANFYDQWVITAPCCWLWVEHFIFETVRMVNHWRAYIFTGCVCHTWHASRWIVATDFQEMGFRWEEHGMDLCWPNYHIFSIHVMRIKSSFFRQPLTAAHNPPPPPPSFRPIYL